MYQKMPQFQSTGRVEKEMNTNIKYVALATLITILSIFASSLSTVTIPTKMIISIAGAIAWGIVLGMEARKAMKELKNDS